MNARVMIVDDEQDVREPLAEYLRTIGMHVITAADGSEALTKLKSNPVDIMGDADAARAGDHTANHVDVIGGIRVAVSARDFAERGEHQAVIVSRSHVAGSLCRALE